MFSTFSTNQLMRYGCLIVICLAAILVLATDRSDSFLPQYGLTKSSLPNAGPVGTCNKSGTYTQYKSLQSNGTVSMHWSPSLPLTNKFGYQIRVNGFGWIDASLSHAVTSPRFGTIGSGSKSFTRTKVGSFYVILLVPYASAVTEQTVGEKVTASYNNEGYDTYSWTASGTVSLQAVYWKATAGYPFMGGSWENLGSAVPYTYNSPGSWTLTGKLLCPKCSQEVSHFSRHNVTCSGIQRYARGTFGSCDASYWLCDPIDARKHRVLSCGEYKYRLCTGHYCFQNSVQCPAGSTCDTVSNGNNGGNNGGTTSPAVDNGGGTIGGTTGGTSSDRVRCGNAGTGRTSCNKGGYASSSTAHQSVCELGHTYWTCNVAQNNLHGVRHSNRTCVRCGTTFNSRTNGRCTSRWGTIYRWHWEG